MSRSWLRQVLSDSTEFGDGWRAVLGGAPRLSPADSIVQITEEAVCGEIARLINAQFLRWQVGPPPVVVFRVGDYLIAYPSNAPIGEFGLAFGMSPTKQLRGVVAW